MNIGPSRSPPVRTASGRTSIGTMPSKSQHLLRDWNTAVSTASLKPTCTGLQLTWCSLLKMHWDATRVTARILASIGKPLAIPATLSTGAEGINDQHEIID